MAAEIGDVGGDEALDGFEDREIPSTLFELRKCEFEILLSAYGDFGKLEGRPDFGGFFAARFGRLGRVLKATSLEWVNRPY